MPASDHLPGSAVEAIARVREAAGVLAATVRTRKDRLASDDPDVKREALTVVAHVGPAARELSDELRAVSAEAEQATIGAIPYGERPRVPGRGRLRVRRKSGKQTWDGRRVTALLAARLADEMVDRETGEVPPVAVIVQRTMTAVVDAAGLDNASFRGWRRGVLKDLGIDPEAMVEKEPGALYVEVED